MLKKQEFCFGRQPVLEALESGADLERIFIRKGMAGPAFSQIDTAARSQGIPVNRVPKEKLNRLTNLNHQGVIALLSPVKYYRVEDIVDKCFAEGRDPLLVVLDGVTDVGNFGAVCRTALGLNVDAVVIGHFRAAPVNAQAIKSSAGAIHHLKICRQKEISDVVEYLRTTGIRVIAMDGSAEKFFHEIDLDGPLAILMGSEDRGVGKDLMELVDEVGKLPMNDKLESFNISVAAAMALYEVSRSKG